jgi:hypothetical protein
MKTWIAVAFTVFIVTMAAQAAQSEPLRMPPILVGDWCDQGDPQGSVNVGGVPAEVYVNCRDNIGGGKCEDLHFVAPGHEMESCTSVDDPIRIINTQYGLDITFESDQRLLFNMIAPDRLLVT